MGRDELEDYDFKRGDILRLTCYWGNEKEFSEIIVEIEEYIDIHTIWKAKVLFESPEGTIERDHSGFATLWPIINLITRQNKATVEKLNPRTAKILYG